MTEGAQAAARSTGLAARDRSGLVRFALIGGLSFLIDAGLLVLIAGPLGRPVWLAATVGFWTSVVVNFALNRAVFSDRDSRGSATAHGARYGLLLAVNYVVTLVIVQVGVAQGLPPVVPKIVAVALTMGWNLVLYRRWVFR